MDWPIVSNNPSPIFLCRLSSFLSLPCRNVKRDNRLLHINEKANEKANLKYRNVVLFSCSGTSGAHVMSPSCLATMCAFGLKLCSDSTSHRCTYFLSSKLPCHECLRKCDCSRHHHFHHRCLHLITPRT